MLSETDYASLLSGKTPFIVVEPDGKIEKGMLTVNSPLVHIVSGSFNPLHMGHKRLYLNASRNGTTYFEISIARDGKEPYTLADINRIIKQFAWYAAVIITNAKTFSEKRRLLPNMEKGYFHVGSDTANRILRDYTADDLEKHDLMFCVYGRTNITVPTNDPRRSYSRLVYIEEADSPYLQEAKLISSTELRNGNASGG